MISAAERQERLESVESIVGTHRAEGISFDVHSQGLMQAYAEGNLSLEQLSAAMRAHAATLLSKSVGLETAA